MFLLVMRIMSDALFAKSFFGFMEI